MCCPCTNVRGLSRGWRASRQRNPRWRVSRRWLLTLKTRMLDKPGLAETENTYSHLHHLLCGSVEIPTPPTHTSSSCPRSHNADTRSHTTDSVKHLNARPPSTYWLHPTFRGSLQNTDRLSLKHTNTYSRQSVEYPAPREEVGVNPFLSLSRGSGTFQCVQPFVGSIQHANVSVLCGWNTNGNCGSSSGHVRLHLKVSQYPQTLMLEMPGFYGKNDRVYSMVQKNLANWKCLIL